MRIDCTQSVRVWLFQTHPGTSTHKFLAHSNVYFVHTRQSIQRA